LVPEKKAATTLQADVVCPAAGTRWYPVPALEEKAENTTMKPQADAMCPASGTRWYPMPDDP
jgi:hypothetical protein